MFFETFSILLNHFMAKTQINNHLIVTPTDSSPETPETKKRTPSRGAVLPDAVGEILESWRRNPPESSGLVNPLESFSHHSYFPIFPSDHGTVAYLL